MAKVAKKTKQKKAGEKSDRKKSAKSAASRAPAVAAAGRPQAPVMTIRHFCQGIGDCHLLTFPRPDGTAFRMLIDCGVHTSVKGGSKRVDEIARQIKSVVGDETIDVLVVTHEHWDHVSGFKTAAEIFGTIKFGEVWMGWTENPDDPQAKKLDTYKGQALTALTLASEKLAAKPALSRHLAEVRDGLNSLMGFQFGLEGDKVRGARNAAAGAAKGKKPRYLKPGEPPIPVEGIPNLQIYVLGPPLEPELLRLEEQADEMYHFGGRPGWELERTLTAAMMLDDGEDENWALESAPFYDHHGHDLAELLSGNGDAVMQGFVREHYAGDVALPAGKAAKDHLADQSWRRIDADWLGMAADLALQLDKGINNTSVVLAFEFVDTGRVILFPGDAQIGSWKSWHKLDWTVDGKEVKAKDLLARTVYLKVAHHGSHNATPHRLGLEQMTSSDLSAFIPVNEADAKKAGWNQMPFNTILNELGRRTAGRVIRADDPWLASANGAPAFQAPSGSILAIRNKGEGWIELDVA